MTTTSDQLEVLRRLRADGQITEDEYHDLAGGLHAVAEPDVAEPEELDGPDMEPQPTADTSSAARHEAKPDLVAGDGSVGTETDVPHPDDTGQTPVVQLPPTIRPNISVNYLGALLVASIVLLIAGLLGVLSWWVSLPAVLVLVTTVFEGWGKVTLAGGVVVALVLVADLALAAGDTPAPIEAATVTIPPTDPYPPIPGSLGIYMDQVPDLWNGVDAQPRINRGLTRHNEIGDYDTFIYRFDEWGRVAGAYDPDNDAIYALLVTGTFSGPATEDLYLHLCFMVAPYSPECIDSYYEEGLAGGSLEDFSDVSHNAEWTVGEGTWRLEIDQNVMTIRVYGPDAA